MLCDVCAKNPATVHLTEIVDDQMTELHLCEQCARQKSQHMEQQFGLSDLLAGMAQGTNLPQDKEDISLKCKRCGLTYADFKKIGRLGCSQCYESFKKYLTPLLKRIHGSCAHLGKTPFLLKGPKPAAPAAATKKSVDIEALRQKMQKAIESESFEEAARLRDQIKALEKKAQ